jgi:hypothetical protein
MVDISAIQCDGFVVNAHHCPEGYDCTGATNPDLPGSCVEQSQPKTCGGIAGIQCPAGQKCVDNPNDNCDPANGGADCGGICVEDDTVHCGGIANLQCPDGQHCVDDPNDSCDPANGGADCGGICINDCFDTQFCIQGAHWDSTQCKCVSDNQFCGGIANIQCPPSQHCVDNPNDSCDPNNGGADCGGICVF